MLGKVWKALTNKDAPDDDLLSPTPDTDLQIAQKIKVAAAANKVILFGTRTQATDVPGRHAFYVTGVDTDTSGNVILIKLYNPWGGLKAEEKSLVVSELSRNLAWLYIGDVP